MLRVASLPKLGEPFGSTQSAAHRFRHTVTVRAVCRQQSRTAGAAAAVRTLKVFRTVSNSFEQSCTESGLLNFAVRIQTFPSAFCVYAGRCSARRTRQSNQPFKPARRTDDLTGHCHWSQRCLLLFHFSLPLLSRKFHRLLSTLLIAGGQKPALVWSLV